MAYDDIHRFARRGNLDAIREAVQAGTNIDTKDEFGSTALQNAIAQKQLAAVDLLLALGADVAVQDRDGSTALHWAIEHDLPKVLESLLQKCPEAVSISDKHGNEPLWTAAFRARGQYEIVSLLLKYGANTQHRNNVNLTPLDIPKRKGEAALLQLLESAQSDEQKV